YGENALTVIDGIKKKLKEIEPSLPPGVKIVPTYDRSELIRNSIATLREKLIEESIVVALVCLVFLWHVRSALVAIVTLPIAIVLSFLPMQRLGLTSNIMSLGGIAIAIGAMVDAVIIMIENAHKHLERNQGKKPHWDIIRDAAVEVGPALFYSLLVITVSFLPVFTLQEQEGRLFKPLAFTKTYSMAAAALLSITLAPVLMGWFIRGKIPREEKNPINRFLIWLYKPVVDLAVKYRWLVVVGGGLIVGWVFFPWNSLVALLLPQGRVQEWAFKAGPLFPYQSIGSEFMPPLYEGDLLYMPTTFPGISVTKARQLIQVTDRIIKSFPEVQTVFGKAGRAETATDPAPMDMIETTIQLKPEGQWPVVDIQDDNGKVIAHRRRTPDELEQAMNAAIVIPGLNNLWTMPIATRISMLSTGIKTPVGIKIAGPDLNELEHIGTEVEAVVRQVPGTASAFAERITGGRYIEFEINRDAIARYGLTVGDVQDVLSIALGGMPLTTTVEGLQRYTVNLRYDRDFRSDLHALKHDIVIPTPTGAQIPLGELASIKVVDAPMEIKTEGAVPNDWVYVDIRDIDVGTYVQSAMHAVNAAIAAGQIKLPPGYNLFWSGQYEYMLHAKQRLLMVVPLTLLIISLIIYLNTRSLLKTAIVLLAVPFSLVGAFWTLYLLHYNLSVAVWVGIIALAGLDAETGVIMLLYLDLAYDEWKQKGLMRGLGDLRDAIYHGAVKRLRPKIMTACVIIAGLAPILWSHGTGADVMKRIAAPMVGGVITSTISVLVVYPAIYYLWRSRHLKPVDPKKSGGPADPVSV
ncbi:MAG TPA: CusA/CzcA family heavy metal efflux RND transporter, partial [Candidatus Limnocylindrales bacterium]|nr:CusA/CzcA family heavy metal efflux RND transporter [Candidatus Limnocylindrales bacterium]